MNLKKFLTQGQERWLPVVGLAAAFGYLLPLSWLKWGDLIIDSGREMLVPERLAAGECLYRDVFYLYGPFSPYFHAGLFKIFGVSLTVLIGSGIVTTIFSTILVYKIARQLMDRAWAFLTTETFLFVFAFGHYVYLGNYNFILPFSYPATHSILFSLAAIFFFFRYGKHKRPRDQFAVMALSSLCLLSKAEIGVLLLISLLAALVMARLFTTEIPKTSRPFASFIGVPALVAAFIYGVFFLASRSTLHGSNLSDLFAANTTLASPFTAWLSGIITLPQNLWLMAKSLLGYAAFAALFWMSGYVAETASAVSNKPLRTALQAIIVTVTLAAVLSFLRICFSPELQYRALPVFLIAMVVVIGLKVIRKRQQPHALPLISLSLFALLITMRMIFSIRPAHYGFYLLVPGMIVYHIFLAKILAPRLHNTTARRFFLCGFYLTLIVLAAGHFQISRLAYAQRSLYLKVSRGEMRLFPTEREIRSAKLIDFLKQHTPPDATVAVFPEGATIPFLAERQAPLYYYSFLPVDLVRERVEDDIIADMRKKKLDYVVVVARSVEEYGRHAFGGDYGKKIGQYIAENYTPIKLFGPFPYTSPEFGIAVFKRNPA